MTALAAVPETWNRPCATPTTTFTIGTRVQHRNPDLSDWRGVIEAPLDGAYAGRHLRWDTCSHHGDEPCVRVRWTQGSTDLGNCGEVAGWFGVSAIEALEPDVPEHAGELLRLLHKAEELGLRGGLLAPGECDLIQGIRFLLRTRLGQDGHTGAGAAEDALRFLRSGMKAIEAESGAA